MNPDMMDAWQNLLIKLVSPQYMPRRSFGSAQEQRKKTAPRTGGGGIGKDYCALAMRYRKHIMWPLVQVILGAKVVSLIPVVMPFSTAHRTAS